MLLNKILIGIFGMSFEKGTGWKVGKPPARKIWQSRTNAKVQFCQNEGQPPTIKKAQPENGNRGKSQISPL